MEKINIAELLKDCPKGMELDCTMYDNATFEGILDDNCFPIKIQMPEGNMHLSKYGCMSLNTHAKCVIFPKGKTTWEGFQRPFKDGDILTYNSTVGTSIFIHRNKKGEHTYKTSFYVGFNVNDRDKLLVYNKYTLIALNGDSDVRFATEEEKKQLFDAIKANGYKWNPETKTLERLTESKEDVNNEILMSGIYFDRKYHADEVELHLGNYEIEIRDGRTYAVLKKLGHKFKVGDKIKQIGSDRHYIIKNIEFDRYILNNNQFIRFTDEHIYELAPNKLVEPKFNVGDEIKYKYPTADTSTLTIIKVECDKNRYVVCDKPNNFCFLSFFAQDNFNFISKTKFDITTLKPYDKVLVRDNDEQIWTADLFSFYNEKNVYPFMCAGHYTDQCIPYEGNEHLLGKKDDCDQFYKTWEE